VVTLSDVKFHENVSALQFVKKVTDEEKWVNIFHGSVIEILIILAGAKHVGVLFRYKEEG
jgi:hypothetical protein